MPPQGPPPGGFGPPPGMPPQGAPPGAVPPSDDTPAKGGSGVAWKVATGVCALLAAGGLALLAAPGLFHRPWAMGIVYFTGETIGGWTLLTSRAEEPDA